MTDNPAVYFMVEVLFYAFTFGALLFVCLLLALGIKYAWRMLNGRL